MTYTIALTCPFNGASAAIRPALDPDRIDALVEAFSRADVAELVVPTDDNTDGEA